eukprot:scaffold13265_cov19-Prasinocladus_malaysianus.AAC.1
MALLPSGTLITLCATGAGSSNTLLLRRQCSLTNAMHSSSIRYLCRYNQRRLPQVAILSSLTVLSRFCSMTTIA